MNDLPDFGGARPCFAFDLDSTVTRCETLPLLARDAGIEPLMRARTERAMRGGAAFATDFPERVALLRGIPLKRARAIIAGAPVHAGIADFLRENAPDCRILTGNLDVWIDGLLEALGMQGRCFCSHAQVADGRLLGVRDVLDKGAAARLLPHPLVAIGDGVNDIPMLRAADFAIAFGGARQLAPDVCAAADRIIYDEAELCRMLRRLIRRGDAEACI